MKTGVQLFPPLLSSGRTEHIIIKEEKKETPPPPGCMWKNVGLGCCCVLLSMCVYVIHPPTTTNTFISATWVGENCDSQKAPCYSRVKTPERSKNGAKSVSLTGADRSKNGAKIPTVAEICKNVAKSVNPT